MRKNIKNTLMDEKVVFILFYKLFCGFGDIKLI